MLGLQSEIIEMTGNGAIPSHLGIIPQPPPRRNTCVPVGWNIKYMQPGRMLLQFCVVLHANKYAVVFFFRQTL